MEEELKNTRNLQKLTIKLILHNEDMQNVEILKIQTCARGEQKLTAKRVQEI